MTGLSCGTQKSGRNNEVVVLTGWSMVYCIFVRDEKLKWRSYLLFIVTLSSCCTAIPPSDEKLRLLTIESST